MYNPRIRQDKRALTAVHQRANLTQLLSFSTYRQMSLFALRSCLLLQLAHVLVVIFYMCRFPIGGNLSLVLTRKLLMPMAIAFLLLL